MNNCTCITRYECYTSNMTLYKKIKIKIMYDNDHIFSLPPVLIFFPKNDSNAKH